MLDWKKADNGHYRADGENCQYEILPDEGENTLVISLTVGAHTLEERREYDTLAESQEEAESFEQEYDGGHVAQPQP